MELHSRNKKLPGMRASTRFTSIAAKQTDDMGEGEKKRKANRHRDDGERPRKKAAITAQSSSAPKAIQVSHDEGSHGLLPVIGMDLSGMLRTSK